MLSTPILKSTWLWSNITWVTALNKTCPQNFKMSPLWNLAGLLMHVLRRVNRPRAIVYILSTLPEWCAAVSRVTNDAFEIGGVSPLSQGVYMLFACTKDYFQNMVHFLNYDPHVLFVYIMRTHMWHIYYTFKPFFHTHTIKKLRHIT